MKKVFLKATSFLMALAVLFSTMSFTVSSHYCGDTRVDSTIFSKLKTCGMESKNPSTKKIQNSNCSITTKNCCSEEIEIIKGQGELKLTLEKISLDQQIFVAAFFYSYNALFITSEGPSPSLTDYPPPNLVRQLFKLDETYLI